MKPETETLKNKPIKNTPLARVINLILSGLRNGLIESEPILDRSDEEAENWPMLSLHDVIMKAVNDQADWEEAQAQKAPSKP